MASRTEEGLYCHHIDEDKAILLCRDECAAENPFEYQKAKRLVYCNLLEHLVLHIKIAEKNKVTSKGELLGIGGAVTFLVRELNDIYSGRQFDDWRQKIAEQVKDRFGDYVTVLRHLWKVISDNPNYAEITKESLCQNSDGEIVPEIAEAF